MCDYSKVLKESEINRQKAIETAKRGNTDYLIQLLITLHNTELLEELVRIHINHLIHNKKHMSTIKIDIFRDFQKLASLFPETIFSSIEFIIKKQLLTKEEETHFYNLIRDNKDKLPAAKKCWNSLKEDK